MSQFISVHGMVELLGTKKSHLFLNVYLLIRCYKTYIIILLVYFIFGHIELLDEFIVAYRIIL